MNLSVSEAQIFQKASFLYIRNVKVIIEVFISLVYHIVEFLVLHPWLFGRLFIALHPRVV